ncbi:adenosylcobinamide amidohydrolase [Melghirimyces profundicolus]|uniref:Adenosylcobinamide amidohydrolase n=1 Tax=Melghirimyces profundicolus TaxID=1242148 RepID=A0A2T6C7L2_9BACL|nr:adenosylcobinamide amidohydrolase [Melghirimyces profundicolus]PTX64308.1 adenosylcobinamide amidohydrolase [Melghirimyces profundicolus]
MKPMIRKLFNQNTLRLHRMDTHLSLRSQAPLTVLSSAPLGGGFFHTQTIVNRQVDKGYRETDPVGETRRWLAQHGYDPGKTAAMLTAASIKDAAVVEAESTRVRVAAVVTAGVSNAARAGTDGPVYTRCPEPGTINTILLVDGQVTEAAMVNTVITVTEAKTAALEELRITDREGRPATGTTTDAVVIAVTGETRDRYVHAYGGPASPLGQAGGRAVFEAVREALLRAGEAVRR